MGVDKICRTIVPQMQQNPILMVNGHESLGGGESRVMGYFHPGCGGGDDDETEDVDVKSGEPKFGSFRQYRPGDITLGTSPIDGDTIMSNTGHGSSASIPSTAESPMPPPPNR